MSKERRTQITIPFVSGLDDESSTLSMPAPGLEKASNISFTHKDTLRARTGFVACVKGDDIQDTSDSENLLRMTTKDNELLYFYKDGTFAKLNKNGDNESINPQYYNFFQNFAGSTTTQSLGRYSLPHWTTQSEHLYGDFSAPHVDHDICVLDGYTTVIKSWELFLNYSVIQSLTDIKDAKWVRLTPAGMVKGEALLSWWDNVAQRFYFFIVKIDSTDSEITVSQHDTYHLTLLTEDNYSAGFISRNQVSPQYAVHPWSSGRWLIVFNENTAGDSDYISIVGIQSGPGSEIYLQLSSKALDLYGVSVLDHNGYAYVFGFTQTEVDGANSGYYFYTLSSVSGNLTSAEEDLFPRTWDNYEGMVSSMVGVPGQQEILLSFVDDEDYVWSGTYPNFFEDEPVVTKVVRLPLSNIRTSSNILYDDIYNKCKIPNCHPVSNIWEKDSKYYQWFVSYLTRTNYLMEIVYSNTTDTIVLPNVMTTQKFNVSYSQLSHKLQTVSSNGDGYYSCHKYFMRPLVGEDLNDPDRDVVIGLNQLLSNPANKESFANVEVDGITYIAGGVLTQYDGKTVQEVNFNERPIIYVDVVNLDEGDEDVKPIGTYSYIGTYETVDSSGNIHRSLPSEPVVVESLYSPWNYVGGWALKGGSPGSATVDADILADDNTIRQNYLVSIEFTKTGGLGTAEYSVYLGPDQESGTPVETEVVPSGGTQQFIDADGNEIGIGIKFNSLTVSSTGSVYYMKTEKQTGFKVSVIPNTLGYRQKNRSMMVPYRTQVDGSIWYRMSTWEDAVDMITVLPNGSYGLQNYPGTPIAYSGWTSTSRTQFEDDIRFTDDIIKYNASIYAPPDGTGELPNTTIWGGCKGLAYHNNRLWTISAENPTQLWYSKEYVRGEAMTFAIGQTIDLQKEIVAIASNDEVLLAFSKESVFAIYGRGPDATGNPRSGIFEFTELDGALGTTTSRSVVEFDAGVLYHSKKGIRLITKGLATIPIGNACLSECDGSTVILDSCQIKSTQEVIWLTNDNAKALVLSYARINDQGIDARFSTWDLTFFNPYACVYLENNKYEDSLYPSNGLVIKGYNSSISAYSRAYYQSTNRLSDLLYNVGTDVVSGYSCEIKTGLINFGTDSVKRMRKAKVSLGQGFSSGYIVLYNSNSVLSPDINLFNPSSGQSDQPSYLTTYDGQYVCYVNNQKGRAWALNIIFTPEDGTDPTYGDNGEFISMTFELSEPKSGQSKGYIWR